LEIANTIWLTLRGKNLDTPGPWAGGPRILPKRRSGVTDQTLIQAVCLIRHWRRRGSRM